MTLSLSVSVFSCVPFFSFRVPEVSSSTEEFQYCFKAVLRVFEVKGSFKDVSRKFKGAYRKLKGASGKFQE